MTQLADAVKRAGGKRRREQNRERCSPVRWTRSSVPYSAGGSGAGRCQCRAAAAGRHPAGARLYPAGAGPAQAEQFFLPQQKELYEAFLQCQEQGIELSLSTLRPFVSEEALNELSRLAAQYSDVNCTPDDIRLYLDRIARGTPVAARRPKCPTMI